MPADDVDNLSSLQYKGKNSASSLSQVQNKRLYSYIYALPHAELQPTWLQDEYNKTSNTDHRAGGEERGRNER